MNTITHSIELVREGSFVAEVRIDLIETSGEWSPYLSLDDAEKLDKVRLALRAGDLKTASEFGRIFELLPVLVD